MGFPVPSRPGTGPWEFYWDETRDGTYIKISSRRDEIPSQVPSKFLNLTNLSISLRWYWLVVNQTRIVCALLYVVWSLILSTCVCVEFYPVRVLASLIKPAYYSHESHDTPVLTNCDYTLGVSTIEKKLRSKFPPISNYTDTVSSIYDLSVKFIKGSYWTWFPCQQNSLRAIYWARLKFCLTHSIVFKMIVVSVCDCSHVWDQERVRREILL